jgi:hypothetical protein
MAKPELTPEEKARRGRNIAMALGLAAFVIIVFITTIVRLGGNVVTRTF